MLPARESLQSHGYLPYLNFDRVTIYYLENSQVKAQPY